MTSREQFETEMAKLGDVVDMRRAKNGDMGYMAWDVSLAWRMWQASREALEVELPCVYGHGWLLGGGGVMVAEDVITAIRAASIKVNGAKQ